RVHARSPNGAKAGPCSCAARSRSSAPSRRRTKPRAISLDRAARAIGQGDVDAAEIKRPRQAFGAIALAPTLDAICERKTGDGRGVGQRALCYGIAERGRQHVGLRADNAAGPALEALGERLRRGEEWRPITSANCAKPVAEMCVDGGDGKTI